MAWIEPIFDRTQSDVDLGLRKGKLGYSDLNRIEGNMEYILDMLGMVYVPNNWSHRPIPLKEDFERILEGLQKIEAGISISLLPSIPSHPINQYEKINRIEQIQSIAYNYLFESNSAFIRTGEAYAGETIGVI